MTWEIRGVGGDPLGMLENGMTSGFYRVGSRDRRYLTVLWCHDIQQFLVRLNLFHSQDVSDGPDWLVLPPVHYVKCNIT